MTKTTTNAKNTVSLEDTIVTEPDLDSDVEPEVKITTLEEFLSKPMSPSRLKDYMQCPKLFYYKSVLNLPSPPSFATVKGNLAHLVFEHIFNLPRQERTPKAALAMVEPAYTLMTDPFKDDDKVEPESIEYQLRSYEKLFASVFDPEKTKHRMALEQAEKIPSIIEDTEKLLEETRVAVSNWFLLEKPQNFDPLERELYVKGVSRKVLLHGYIDRLDRIVSKNRAYIYISDYKTGKVPSERFQDEAFFQLEVYALLVKILMKEDVYALRLIYPALNSEPVVLQKVVTPAILDRTSRKIEGVFESMKKSFKTDSWQTKTQPLCNWCDFQDVCPAWNKDGSEEMLPQEIAKRYLSS